MTYVINRLEVADMPGRDGTGPMSTGAMTGRCMGFCVKTGTAAENAGFGRGRRCGFRRCFAWNSTDYENIAPETVKELLLVKKQILQSRLDAVNKQIEGMQLTC